MEQTRTLKTSHGVYNMGQTEQKQRPWRIGAAERKQIVHIPVITCRKMSSFGLDLLFWWGRHVSFVAGSKRRNWSLSEINCWFILVRIQDYTSTRIVNVAFSWLLFGNRTWWRQDDVGSGVTSFRQKRAGFKSIQCSGNESRFLIFIFNKKDILGNPGLQRYNKHDIFMGKM